MPAPPAVVTVGEAPKFGTLVPTVAVQASFKIGELSQKSTTKLLTVAVVAGVKVTRYETAVALAADELILTLLAVMRPYAEAWSCENSGTILAKSKRATAASAFGCLSLCAKTINWFSFLFLLVPTVFGGNCFYFLIYLYKLPQLKI